MPAPRPPSLLTLPSAVMDRIAELVDLKDLRSLRLVSKSGNTAFSSPALCANLLRLHFPFAVEAIRQRPSAYHVLNALLSQRAVVRDAAYTETLTIEFPPPLRPAADRVYPGFHEFDGASGALVTAESDLATRKVEITVRWLSGTHTVVIPAPLEIGKLNDHAAEAGSARWFPKSPPTILYSNGRIMLVFSKEAVKEAASALGAGALVTVLDAKNDGETLWHGLLQTTIFTGYHRADEGHQRRRELQPVFNSSYMAYLTSVSERDCRLAIIRIPSDASRTTANPTPIICDRRISPRNVRSLQADASGNILLLGECYPEIENIHRIVIFNAHTGVATCAYEVAVGATVQLKPRNWNFALSPNAKQLLCFQSVCSVDWRAALLGQLTIFDLRPTNPRPTRTRYLMVPRDSRRKLSADDRITYDFASGIATIISPGGIYASLYLYPHPNLDCPIAGTGNRDNHRNSIYPLFRSRTPLIGNTLRTLEFEPGREWGYLRCRTPDGGTSVHLLRFSTATTGASSNGSAMRSIATSGWATPRSPAPGYDTSVVDAKELASRLQEFANLKDDNNRAAATGGLPELSNAVQRSNKRGELEHVEDKEVANSVGVTVRSVPVPEEPPRKWWDWRRLGRVGRKLD